jgi:hypothetical protein
MADYDYVYGHTPNGREIREIQITMKTSVFAVQPRDDNYWLVCRTPNAALQAFYAPTRFIAASDRLRKKYHVSM